MLNIKTMETQQLLRLYSEILDELKSREVVRTRNNPVADYAEWIVSQKLNFKLEGNSNTGFDAIDDTGTRYQIKCRRVDPSNQSKQLGVIRNLDKYEFDYLIGVIFAKDFSVQEAYKIPHSIIDLFAKFSEHQNGHILNLRGDLLIYPEVEDITEFFQETIMEVPKQTFSEDKSPVEIPSIEEVIGKMEAEYGCKFKKLSGKQVFYSGILPNGKRVSVCSPKSKIHQNGHGWIDIDVNQIEILNDTDVSILAFRLEGNKVFYLDFRYLKSCLTEDAMVHNNARGNHWKLYIWPEYIQILMSNSKIELKPNEMPKVG